MAKIWADSGPDYQQFLPTRDILSGAGAGAAGQRSVAEWLNYIWARHSPWEAVRDDFTQTNYGLVQTCGGPGVWTTNLVYRLYRSTVGVPSVLRVHVFCASDQLNPGLGGIGIAVLRARLGGGAWAPVALVCAGAWEWILLQPVTAVTGWQDLEIEVSGAIGESVAIKHVMAFWEPWDYPALGPNPIPHYAAGNGPLYGLDTALWGDDQPVTVGQLTAAYSLLNGIYLREMRVTPALTHSEDWQHIALGKGGVIWSQVARGDGRWSRGGVDGGYTRIANIPYQVPPGVTALACQVNLENVGAGVGTIWAATSTMPAGATTAAAGWTNLALTVTPDCEEIVDIFLRNANHLVGSAWMKSITVAPTVRSL